ncbi:MAG TPA: hypothetical protein VMH04_09475 [Candidatus Solibacter sp.]|nr:hypothetical protein [Candidatus Solibacter sp.]
MIFTRTELPSFPASIEFAVSERPDVLRRFVETPQWIDLVLMQRILRLQTNSAAVLALAQKFFERHQNGKVGAPEFTWRIVCEPDPQVQSQDPSLFAFSDFGLRYVSVGQRSFLAVDVERREAVGFLADRFIEDESTIRNNRPLDLLFCMTAPSLGLTSLSGGCVGIGDRGVLVFGPPNSGKTTACYLAAESGMEFHADQMVFLDMHRGVPCVWGDFFPAVFRPKTLEFLPELRRLVRPSSHAGLDFYYFDKAPLQKTSAHPVHPVCSLFLDRGAASEARLKQMCREDVLSRLNACLLFREDARFETQIQAALDALAAQPAYCLQYDNDPKTAAAVIQKLLR